MKITVPRPFFRDVIMTFAAETIVLVSFFWLYRVIAFNYGPEGVGEYSLVKRAVGILQPFLLLGLGVGLPRYLALASSASQRGAFARAGAGAAILLALAVLALANLFKDKFAALFFGAADYSGLVLPFSIFLAGLFVHALVYSYYRGTMAAKRFNVLQLVNLSVVPLAVFVLAAGAPMATAVWLVGVFTLAVSLLFFIPFRKEFFSGVFEKKRTSCFRELFSYSLPRCAGDFIYGAFLSVGPIFAAHASGARAAGYLSVGQSLLVALGALIAPLGLVLLPKVSGMIARGQEEILAKNIDLLVGAATQAGMFLTFQMVIFADIIIGFWLGAEFLPAIPVVRVLFASIMFFAFYSATAGVLNGSRKKPLDMMNVSAALAFFVALAFILPRVFPVWPPVMSLAAAFSAATVFLGILAYRAVRSIYPQKISKDANCFFVALAVNVVLAALALAIKPWALSGVLAAVATAILLGMIYVLILWRIKAGWVLRLLAEASGRN